MKALSDQQIIDRIHAFTSELAQLEFAALTQTPRSSMTVKEIDSMQAVFSLSLDVLRDEQKRRHHNSSRE